MSSRRPQFTEPLPARCGLLAAGYGAMSAVIPWRSTGVVGSSGPGPGGKTGG